MPKSFFYLFGISLVGVLFSSRLQHTEGLTQYSGLIAGIAPLIIYHIGLIQAKSLTTTKIDSVYYFGFLVTVVTLVSTAISLGLAENTPNLRWVLLQFGLGLVATGYALFARLHLVSKSSELAESAVADSNQELANSIKKITEEFDKAGFQVAAFTARTEERLQAVENKFEERLNKAQITFDSAMSKTAEMSYLKTVKIIDQAAEEFGKKISAIMEEVGRIQTEAEAISFQKATERIEGFSSAIETAIKSITTRVAESGSESSKAISELTTTTKKMSQLANELSASLDKIKNLDSLLQSISSVESSLRSVAKTAEEADSAISSLATKTSISEENLRSAIIEPLSSSGLAAALSNTEKAISEAGLKASVSIESMEKAVVAFDENLRGILASLASSTSTASKMSSFESDINAATTGLHSAITTLGQQTNSMAEMINTSSTSLGAAISSASYSLTSIQDRLGALDELASAVRKATIRIEQATQSPRPQVAPFSSEVNPSQIPPNA